MTEDVFPWTLVAIYEVDKAYGGPEEGGWYYTTGTLCTDYPPVVCTTEEEVRAAYAVLNARIDDDDLNEGRPEISSVLSRGRYRVQAFERELPKYFPTERPYYE